MTRLLLIVFLFVLAPLVAQAQTPTPDPVRIVQLTPFTVQATHDGLNATHYRLYVDGAQVGADVPKETALVNGTVSLRSPAGIARGRHTVAIAAWNPDWPEVRSASLPVDAAYGEPSAPGVPTIVETVTTTRLEIRPNADGTFATNVVHVGTIVNQVAP